jgi:hypothetical protein
VTESYEAKSLPLWARVMDVPLNRHKDLMKNMRHTLAQLKTDGERQTRAQLKTEGEKL